MHLEKLPSGRWRAVVRHAGRKRSVSARTRAEAQAAGARLLLEMGVAPRRSDLTIGALVAAYIAAKRTSWSPTTLDDREAAVRLIPDSALAWPADTVTVPMVLGLWRDMAAAGVTPHRVHRAGSIIGSAYALAIRHGLLAVPANPFHLSPPPTPPKADIRVPDIGQVRALLSDGPMVTFVRISATTGARRGEVCGLQWRDIDFERATLSIRRNIVQTKAGLFERPTKTGEKGQRVVTLDHGTITMLATHRDAQQPPGELHLPAPVWVFSDDHGVTPWKPNAITNRFDHHRQRVGATGVRLQDLRHYVATTLLQDGVSPHDVANQLGHANTSTTLSKYAHYVPGRNREAIDRLAGRLD